MEIPTRRGRLGTWLQRRRAELRLSARMTAAALAAFALAELLHLAQGYWAVFTAIVVTQSSVGGSLKASIDRFIGTLGGAVFGAVIALLVPHQSVPALGVALVAAVAPLAVLAATSASFRIAPVTAIIVLLGTSSAAGGPARLGDGPGDRDRARLHRGIGGLAAGIAGARLRGRAHGDRTGAERAGGSPGGAGDGADDEAAMTRSTASSTSACARRSRRWKPAPRRSEHERHIYVAAALDAKPLVRGARRLHADLVIIGRAAAAPLPEPMRTRLAPRLAEISRTIGEFLRGTGAALAERRDPPTIGAVSAALDGYAAAMAELRRERLTRDLSDEEAGRIFALGFGLEQLRRDLGELASRAAEFVRPAASAGRPCRRRVTSPEKE